MNEVPAGFLPLYECGEPLKYVFSSETSEAIPYVRYLYDSMRAKGESPPFRKAIPLTLQKRIEFRNSTKDECTKHRWPSAQFSVAPFIFEFRRQNVFC
jgi:hypothetical protein